MPYCSNTITAEQKRLNKSNEEMAELLNCSRPTYERKKRTGKFLAHEAKIMCKLFDCDFYYLFGDE